MLTPDQFRVNEAWIVAKVNDAFVFVKDVPYDIYMLMDAASIYVFGNLITRAIGGTPSKNDVEELFRNAWKTKKQWAEKLIIPEHSIAENAFRTQAEKNGLSVKIVPLLELMPIIGPLKESFASDFRGNAT